MGGYWILAIIAALAIAFPRVGFVAGIKRWRLTRRQERIEHGLKFLHEAIAEAQVISTVGLAEGLGIADFEAQALVTRMEAAGLVTRHDDILGLTDEGEALAIHMVRAHRLWERYLADEARLPLGHVHPVACKVEHSLGEEQLEALDAHLGYPATDPHGDPIPNASGQYTQQDRMPLDQWPVGQRAIIVHVEDEPVSLMGKVLDAGMRPNVEVVVSGKDGDDLIVDAPGGEQVISPAAARQIHVTQTSDGKKTKPGARRLSSLKVGQKAEVVAFSQRCQGLSRRRLLDMGLTPGAEIAAELSSPLNSAMGYRIRGTLVALRKEQADQIWIDGANDKTKSLAG